MRGVRAKKISIMIKQETRDNEENRKKDCQTKM